MNSQEPLAPCQSPLVSKRRGFLKWASMAFTALCMLPGRVARAKVVALDLKKLPEISKVGGSVMKKFSGQSFLFVRTGEQTIKVVDPTCTHKKCNVVFKEKTGNLHCKCHKSAFTLSGKVMGGPAPEPLTVFRSKIKDGRLLIKMGDVKKAAENAKSTGTTDAKTK